VYSSQSWQPADRFWRFQWLDVAIFTGLPLVLLGVTIRATLRRAS
jgi:hypothetical protein